MLQEQVYETGHPPSECHQLQWKFTETQTLCDQGYGSERSPEDELPPPLSSHGSKEENMSETCESPYPFITAGIFFHFFSHFYFMMEIILELFQKKRVIAKNVKDKMCMIFKEKFNNNNHGNVQDQIKSNFSNGHYFKYF